MEDYITNTECKIREIVSELGWDYSAFVANTNSKSYVVCPNNSSHRVPTENLDSHLEKCSWVSEGYDPDEPSLSISCTNGPSVTFTPELQEEVIKKAAAEDPNFRIGSNKNRPVPKTCNRLVQTFTRDERLALYDYVVSQTEAEVKRPEVNFPVPIPEVSGEKRELTELELAVAERDAKRRRATYRNKVHTSRKTHVEIMREVIESQMNCLIDESSKEPAVPVTAESSTKHSHEHRTKSHDRYHERRRSSSSRRDRIYHKDKYRDRREDRKSSSSRHHRHKETHRSRDGEEIKKEILDSFTIVKTEPNSENLKLEEANEGYSKDLENLEKIIRERKRDSKHKKHKKERKHKKKKKKRKSSSSTSDSE